MDALTYFFPVKEFLRVHVVEQGAIPFWNPYLFCGMPFAADIQVGAFYPGGILFYFFPAEHAYGWTVFLHCFLAAVGMFFFALSLGFSASPAWICGFLYAFNGFVMRHVYAGHLTVLQSLACAPWVWWAFQRAKHCRGPAGFAGLTLSMAILFLAGHPPLTLQVLLFLFVLIAATVWDSPALRKRCVVIGLTAFVVGCMVAGIQLLPSLELVSWSSRRHGLDYQAAVGNSLHPTEVLNIFFPSIFGRPHDGTFWPGIHHSFWESGGYVGILGIVGMFGVCLRGNRSVERLCLLMLGFALFCAAGKYNPLFRIFQSLPPFNLFRNPVQFLFVGTTLISLLAASTFQVLFVNHTFLFRRVLFLSLALIVAVILLFLNVETVFIQVPHADAKRYVADSLVRFSAGVGILAVLVWGCVGRGPCRRFLPCLLGLFMLLEMWTANRFLIRPTENYRLIREWVARLSDMTQGGSSRFERIYPTLPLDYGNATLLSRQFSVRGYNPLMLSPYTRFILDIDGRRQGNENYIDHVDIRNLKHPALRLLSLRHVVIAARGVHDELDSPLPRLIWLRRPAAKVDDASFADLRPPDESPAVSAAGQIIDYRPDAIMAIADAPESGGAVFFSEIFYPGWTAHVDGRPVEIHSAYGLFRAIDVTIGRHRIEMRYSARIFWLGGILSMIGLTTCAIAYAHGRREQLKNG